MQIFIESLNNQQTHFSRDIEQKCTLITIISLLVVTPTCMIHQNKGNITGYKMI